MAIPAKLLAKLLAAGNSFAHRAFCLIELLQSDLHAGNHLVFLLGPRLVETLRSVLVARSRCLLLLSLLP